jgi:hypothetical protein
MGFLKRASGSGLPLTFQQIQLNSGSLTTYSFASSTFGTAAFDRIIIIAVSTGTTHSVVSATIGGVSATKAIASGSTARPLELWYAAVPTGTTGTISVTMDSLCNDLAVASWAGYPASSTPIDAVGNNSAAASTVSIVDLDKIAGGFVILAGYHSASAQRVTFTQTGAEAITEDFDQVANTAAFAGGRLVVTSTISTDDFTGTWGTSGNVALVGASWK